MSGKQAVIVGLPQTTSPKEKVRTLRLVNKNDAHCFVTLSLGGKLIDEVLVRIVDLEKALEAIK